MAGPCGSRTALRAGEAWGSEGGEGGGVQEEVGQSRAERSLITGAETYVARVPRRKEVDVQIA
jgi:hypothetical protein